MSRAATLDYERARPPVVGKIVRRLIPFLCLLYIVNYIDRTNVAMAKLQFMRDVAISEAAYGLGAGLFFIGYFLFEVPSNLIMQRVGARRWIARIMISWGVVSAVMMLVSGTWSFYALRFLLGVTEAGFFPGIILYLTYWVPSRYRAGITAAFFTSTAISGIIGSPLAGLLMKLEGTGGLHGWQWLFLIEGVVPVMLGVFVWVLLPDKPADAKWLTDADKEWIATELAAEEGHESRHHVADLAAALRSSRLWHLAGIYFMAIMGLYGLSFWTPTLIKAASPVGVSDLSVGCLSAIPYAFGVVAMILIARHSDQTGERRRHIAVTCMIAAAGMTCVSQSQNLPAVIAALSLAAIGTYATFGPFWALATNFLRGSAAAGGIAAVNSVGNLAGFLAPYAVGYAKQKYGTFMPGLLLVAAALVVGTALVLMVPKAVDAPGEVR